VEKKSSSNVQWRGKKAGGTLRRGKNSLVILEEGGGKVYGVAKRKGEKQQGRKKKHQTKKVEREYGCRKERVRN